MDKNLDIDRRAFLKSTTLAAAGVAVIGVNQGEAEASGAEWTNRSPINPDIPNTKVVCCFDNSMVADTSAANVAQTLLAQNNCLNTARVEFDLDELAKKLTGKNDAGIAWATIFRKAATKQWSEVKVAIKVNCIYDVIMPRVAMVGKVCKELIKIGISAENITIYDACHDASGDKKYTPFIGNGIPAGVKVQSGKGSTTSITVGSGKMNCTNIVVSADILVNFAVNKGHSPDKGGFTLTMKNHTGTMKFKCPSSIDELIAENKCNTIIGGEIPKQQLCIVDSIWGAVKGPFNLPTHLPCRIAMGTFGPAVDIMVARNIREKVMNATHSNSDISNIADGFGYTESDFTWEEFTPSATGTVVDGEIIQSFTDLSLNVRGNHTLEHTVKLQIPSENPLSKAVIVNMSGVIIKTFSFQNRQNRLDWDGLDKSGKCVVPGMYAIKIAAGNFTDAKVFCLVSR